MQRRLSQITTQLQPTVPTATWTEFGTKFKWQQGEHVSLIGPTGGGKTTLALKLIDRRKRSVILGTKRADDTLTRFLKENRDFKKYSTWPPHALDKRVVLWPEPKSIDKYLGEQGQVFRTALEDIYFKQGNWCVLADELRYHCEQLRLTRHFELIWLQGRSMNISLVAIGQRPAWLPRSIYSQATHLFFWRTQDESDLKSIGGCGASNSNEIRKIVASLPKHHVLYLNTRDGEMVQTKVDI